MGSFLAFASALSYASGYILIRTGVRPGDADGGAFVSTIANVVLLAGAVLIGLIFGVAPRVDWTAFAWFAAGGFLGPYLGRNLLFAGIHRIGPIRASSLVNTAPIVTIGLAVVVLGEQLSWGSIVATLLVGVGLVILTVEAFGLQPAAARAPAGGPDEFIAVSQPAEASRVRAVARDLRRHAGGRLDSPVAIGLVAAGLSAVAFGIARTVRQVGMNVLPDPLLGATVGAVAGLIVHLAAQASQGQLRAIVRSTFLDPRPRLWVAGALSAVGLLAFFAALTYESLAHVAVISASETLLTLILGGLFLRNSERLSARVAIPALCVFGGGIIVALT